MDIATLLKEARKTWGDDTLTLDQVLVGLGVVIGDIHRIARTQQEGGAIDEAELKKELGNIIYSMIRWCDDLGYDPKECISSAQQAQTKYASKLRDR